MYGSARSLKIRRGDVGCLTFLFGHGAPDAVRLTHPQRMLTADLKNRAAGADGRGCVGALAARRASLTAGMEEEVRIPVPTGSVELPFPQICDRPRQAGYGAQRGPLSMIRAGCRSVRTRASSGTRASWSSLAAEWWLVGDNRRGASS